jgi:hypothetical protein
MIIILSIGDKEAMTIVKVKFNWTKNAKRQFGNSRQQLSQVTGHGILSKKQHGNLSLVGSKGGYSLNGSSNSSFDFDDGGGNRKDPPQ